MFRYAHRRPVSYVWYVSYKIFVGLISTNYSSDSLSNPGGRVQKPYYHIAARDAPAPGGCDASQFRTPFD
jgi:hypothetical protein